jgi:hypothetical protein
MIYTPSPHPVENALVCVWERGEASPGIGCSFSRARTRDPTQHAIPFCSPPMVQYILQMFAHVISTGCFDYRVYPGRSPAVQGCTMCRLNGGAICALDSQQEPDNNTSARA